MKRTLVLAIISVLMVMLSSAQDRRDWPRLMVIFDEKIDGEVADARLVASKIEEVFLEKGFRLVDKGQFENVTARDLALAEGNPARAKEIGLRYGAELLIVGKAQGKLEAEKEFYGVKNFEYSAKGDAKVLITDTGELIAVSSKTSKKAGGGQGSASNLTMETLGNSLAEDLYVKIRMKLQEEVAGPRIIQIVLLGIDAKQVSAYENSLPRDVQMIQRIKLRYMEKDGAVFEATVNGSLDDLRQEFAKRDDIAVVGVTGTRLDLSTKENFERAKGSPMLTSPLEITDFKVENIFPSQVNYYAYNPLASIDIENSAKAEIKNVKVGILIPGYMSLPSEQIVPSVAAGSKQSFKLPASLDAKQLYGLSTNTTAQAKVELSYTYNGQPQTRSLVKPVTLYSRNTISWRRGESIGSFITDTDESVVSFARYVVGSVANDEKLSQKLPRNVANALAVWNGVRAHGINYVSDPWKAADQDILDVVQYPRETLASHTGDCDDSSVLLASCLENIGVRTKFIATNDHIFLMFDTDIMPKNGYMVSQNPDDYIIDENRVWIPLEATMINKPFTAAWKAAAESYKKYTEGGSKLEIIDTRKAKTAFPPANLSFATKPVTPPDAAKIATLVSQDLTDYEFSQSQMTSAASASLASSTNPVDKNKAAIIQAKAGNFDAAIAAVGNISTAESENTLGNIYLMKNELPIAQEHYQKSLALSSVEGGVYMNFGLARYLAGDTAGAVESFQAAIAKFDSKEKAFEVLGLEKVNEALGLRGAEATRRISKNDLFDLLNRSLTTLPDKQASSSQAARVRAKYKNEQNRFVFGGRRGADPTQIASVKEFLFWKE